MAEFKNNLLKNFKNSPIQIGDTVFVLDSILYKDNQHLVKNKYVTVNVVNVYNDHCIVSYNYNTYDISKNDILRNDNHIGANPFHEYSWHNDCHTMPLTLGWVYNMKGVSYTLDDGTQIMGFNFNPYMTDKDNNKVYYQRDLCWDLNDKQNFIESIYHEMNCGAIVIRYNDDKRMTECKAEFDIIDGKQRLTTLISFFNDEFPDKNGFFWSDLSVVAQRKFKSLQLMTIYEFRENVTDDKIKKAFLNVNYEGKPMSSEHLEFVKSINV